MQWYIPAIILIVVVSLVRWYLKNPGAAPRERLSTEMFQDPNCETYVSGTDAIRATIAGRDHYFCSGKCADEYRKKHSAV